MTTRTPSPPCRRNREKGTQVWRLAIPVGKAARCPPGTDAIPAQLEELGPKG